MHMQTSGTKTQLLTYLTVDKRCLATLPQLLYHYGSHMPLTALHFLSKHYRLRSKKGCNLVFACSFCQGDCQHAHTSKGKDWVLKIAHSARRGVLGEPYLCHMPVLCKTGTAQVTCPSLPSKAYRPQVINVSGPRHTFISCKGDF